MNFTKISYQEILNISGVLKTCAINLEMILNNELNDLLNRANDEEVYSGMGKEKVEQDIRTLQEKLPLYNEKLNNCAKKLELIVDDYRKGDEQIANM